MTFAQQTIDRALRAAAALADAAPPPQVPRDLAESAVRSERYLTHHGAGLQFFAPLSRFWKAQDGWVRTHANYPWHRAALLDALGTTEETAGDAIAALPAAEVEQRVYAAGGLAVRLRSADAWRVESGLDHPPLVTHHEHGEAQPRTPRTTPTAHAPLAGTRVLDFTRVLAGPTCTRLLGALGADVLRIDDPHRPELDAHQLDGLLAKRSALLTLPSDTLETLLAGADVVVTGYRPDALNRFGLAPEDLAQRHPGLVVVTLSAWGDARGWEHRRGFDSLVQVATGIADAATTADGTPGALPYQALDHGTGYLMAAAAAELLQRQRRDGGTHHAALALAHTAAHVLRDHLPFPDDAPAVPVITQHQDTVLVPPPAPGRDWPGPPRAYGQDAPVWA